ncbi:MAG: hypothetical protein DME05_22550, partial [Candidatus Rokuibacteriota bacterium]
MDVMSEPSSRIIEGWPLGLHDTVKNQGTATAVSSTNRYYLLPTDNLMLDAGFVLGERSVTELPPAGEDPGFTIVTVPINIPLGQYKVAACADAFGVVDEGNQVREANNCTPSTQAALLACTLLLGDFDPDNVISNSIFTHWTSMGGTQAEARAAV